ncbi:hypothetical protein CIB48_g12038 [Xylaria polymorpha]|nr:hypothetical protein CIB48_g12038 [Xylaria polymorpha]
MRYYITEPGYVIAAAILISVLDIVAVSLRFWARKKQKEKLKADDWLLIPSIILVTAIGISITFGVAKRSIAYPTEIPPDFNGNPLDITTPQITLIYKATLWGTTTGIVENCVDTMHLVLSVCITGFILDLIIITTPIPLVWQLNLSLPKKISIVGVFLLGSVSIVASLLRLINLARLVAQGFTGDGLLVVTQYLYWGLVESGVAILAACLPTLQFLIRKHSWEPTIRATKNILSFKGSSNWSRSGYTEEVSAQSREQIEIAPLSQFDTNPRTSNSTTKLPSRESAYPMESMAKTQSAV